MIRWIRALIGVRIANIVRALPTIITLIIRIAAAGNSLDTSICRWIADVAFAGAPAVVLTAVGRELWEIGACICRSIANGFPTFSCIVYTPFVTRTAVLNRGTLNACVGRPIANAGITLAVINVTALSIALAAIRGLWAGIAEVVRQVANTFCTFGVKVIAVEVSRTTIGRPRALVT